MPEKFIKTPNKSKAKKLIDGAPKVQSKEEEKEKRDKKEE